MKQHAMRKSARRCIQLLVLTTGLLPVFARSSGAGLELVGQARLDFMLWPVYESRLYAPQGTYREGTRPLRLEIEYLRAIQSGALIKRTGKEWRQLGLENSRTDSWLNQLEALWPDVEDGDTLAIEVRHDGVSVFYFNGQRLGALEDPEFGAAFLAIWLSPDTSRPEHRKALLGDR